jgi:PAS domain S-box-containing protein
MQLKWSNDVTLRELAERAVLDRALKPEQQRDRTSLLHELLLHRTELEMQNEALRDVQHELERSEERYKALFENAPVGYLVVDDGCRILAANVRATELLGTAANVLRDTPLQTYLAAEESIGFERYRREIARSKGVLTAEFTILGADGKRREIRFEGARPDPNAGVLRLAMIDMTARNSMARQLDHSERLDALGRHASGVAHDLNNLLYSVMGHTEAALRSLSPKDAAYTPVLRLRDVVQRCSDATAQLATFTRSETARPRLLDLNAVIAEKGPELGCVLGEHIELVLRLDAPNCVVRMEEEHVHQILLSAARNAAQAMPHGGSFVVETATRQGAEDGLRHRSPANRLLCWTMTDTGVGMSESTRARAFDPFFTTKPPGMGTGLGLSLVASVVERAGGSTCIESQLGRGTTLVIELPCATIAEDFAAQEAPSSRSPVVMVVEEDAVLRARLAVKLRDAGCSVIQAGREIEAIELLSELADALGVLLVDDALPEAAIAEFIRTARAVAPYVEIIIAPIGDGDEDDTEDALETVTRLALTAIQRQSAQ